MPSNVINLSAELEAREDSRALTPKQILTIELRNDYNEKARLRRAIEFHKVAYKHRVKDYIKIAERIEASGREVVEGLDETIYFKSYSYALNEFAS